MKIPHLFRFALLALTATLFACDPVGEDERLVYVKPAAVSRAVLIEDFTGQRCVNCPSATDEIHRLQQQYGDTAVIAVGIHAGPLAFYTNTRFTGLRTATGDEYYDHWQLEYQPVGLVNRGAPAEYGTWGTLVRSELQKPSSLSITVNCDEPSDGRLPIQVSMMGTDGPTQGKLQVWLVEDQVTAFQLMPDGTRNDDYLHQHVFRTAVNGTWGENVVINEGVTTSVSYQPTLDATWKVDNLSVVAFVYNDVGVQQVTRHALRPIDQ